MCEIRSEIYGASDHCPLVMEIDTSIIDEGESSVATIATDAIVSVAKAIVEAVPVGVVTSTIAAAEASS